MLNKQEENRTKKNTPKMKLENVQNASLRYDSQ